MMKLIIDGQEATQGQDVTTADGESGILHGWREPHKPGSTGRVWVQMGDNDRTVREFFPSVIRAKFIE